MSHANTDGPADRAAWKREVNRLRSQDDWNTPTTRRLNQDCASLSKQAKPKGEWGRHGRWWELFCQFAHKISLEKGVPFNSKECVKSVSMCRFFLTSIAKEIAPNGDGFSRPAAARRCLNAEREELGVSSLCDIPSINRLLEGIKKKFPRNKRQAEALHVEDVCEITESFGYHSDWEKHQIALMIAIGFLSIMRGIELLSLRRDGVLLVYADLSEAHFDPDRPMPDVNRLLGVHLLVCWRKNNQYVTSWLPLRCKKTISMLLHHMYFVCEQAPTNEFVFCSAKRGKGGRYPNKSNPLGANEFRKGIKEALVSVCGFPWEAAKLFATHSLRVGGSCFMRDIGISDDLHRRMGGWFSLTSSSGYMQMTAEERFRTTKKLCLSSRRVCGPTPDMARQALNDSISRLCL